MLTLLLALPYLETARHLFEKYVFGDWNALAYLLVLFVIDTLLGIARSFKQGRFHSRGMRQMFRKLGEYSIGVVVAHVFCNIEIDGAKVDWVQYGAPTLKYLVYLAILVIETKSIDENMRGLGWRGLPMPKSVRRGLTDFEENGEFRSKVAPEGLPPAAPPTATNPADEAPIL